LRFAGEGRSRNAAGKTTNINYASMVFPGGGGLTAQRQEHSDSCDGGFLVFRTSTAHQTR
jgi:hypothetical protein